jgi:two-component system cell cycle sensor histidine kinase/response regulator CckA
VVPAGPDAAKPDAPVPDVLSGRVLVMDDEDYVRDVACACLKRLGLRVDAAHDGAAALELFRASLNSQDPYDLIILDLTIAGSMGGVETLSLLRQLLPTVQAIASSGYSEDPVMARPQDFGFSGALPKPYTIRALDEAVRPFIGRRSSDKTRL